MSIGQYLVEKLIRKCGSDLWLNKLVTIFTSKWYTTFREEQAMSRHRVSPSPFLSSSHTTQTQLLYKQSPWPQLPPVHYTDTRPTSNVVCPSGAWIENRPHSTPFIRLARNPKHVIVQWVGIGTHTHTQIQIFIGSSRNTQGPRHGSSVVRRPRFENHCYRRYPRAIRHTNKNGELNGILMLSKQWDSVTEKQGDYIERLWTADYLKEIKVLIK